MNSRLSPPAVALFILLLVLAGIPLVAGELPQPRTPAQATSAVCPSQPVSEVSPFSPQPGAAQPAVLAPDGGLSQALPVIFCPNISPRCCAVAINGNCPICTCYSPSDCC